MCRERERDIGVGVGPNAAAPHGAEEGEAVLQPFQLRVVYI